MTAACQGLRVIDFSFWMAGPLATMVLADNGAEVIKVEPPQGDPARDLPAFQTWNRGKKSVILDLKTQEGRRQAESLLRAADVVVVGFRPGVPERLGIDYERVHDLNPRAVYVSITGFGEEGKFRHLKGYEALVTAKNGRMMMFEGIAERPGPGFPVLPYASYSAAMLALQGILAALHRRRQSGRGQKVSISLLAALMPYDLILWIGRQLVDLGPQPEGVTANMLIHQLLGQRQMLTGREALQSDSRTGRGPERAGAVVPRPNYLTAVTKDGVWLQFANTIDHHCFAQMRALDLVDLYTQERFARLPAVSSEADAEAVWEIVLERVRSRTYQEWSTVFEQDENISVERIRWPLEAADHPQVIHNGHMVEVPGLRDQPTRQVGPLIRLSRNEARIRGRAPLLGEHTEEVLRASPPLPAPAPLPPNDAPPQERGPLSGTTVVDFSAWIAAPYATGILANLGARVIRVEPVGGDFSRHSTRGLLAFPMTQGKESIALDLRQPEGRQIAHQLIARADLLIHNLRTGVPERLGIDYETCRRLNPRIVYLNAASYGDSGPYCRRPAFYAAAAAACGSQMRQAGQGHPPPGSQDLPLHRLKEEAWRLLRAAEWGADTIAALATAAAALLGLYVRDATGEGQEIMTTMICSNMYANTDELIDYQGRPDPPRVDAELYGLGPLYRLYRAADGWVFLACPRRAEWEAFCRAVDRSDLADGWEEAWKGGLGAVKLAEAISDLLRGRTAAEWERAMQGTDVPLVAVETRDPARFSLEEEAMKSLGYMVRVRGPVFGDYWRHGALHRFSEDGHSLGPWEPLGGHTRQILSELGYSSQQIEELIAAGIAEAWTPNEGQAGGKVGHDKG